MHGVVLTKLLPIIWVPLEVYFNQLGDNFISMITCAMDKLKLKGQNLGRVFNSRSSCICAMHLCCLEAKWPSLKLKTQPKQLLGSLPLAFALPACAL
jgi:hypothetical protein